MAATPYALRNVTDSGLKFLRAVVTDVERDSTSYIARNFDG